MPEIKRRFIFLQRKIYTIAADQTKMLLRYIDNINNFMFAQNEC